MKYLVAILGLLSSLAQAEVQPFTSGSLKKIQDERTGRPFILALWSASCTHCPEELRVLGQWVKKYPRTDIVLISTDSPAESEELSKLVQNYGLSSKQQWVFADPQPEKLRFEIDRRWYGELPRTYFFDAQHRRLATSGLIPHEQLERWIKDHVK